MNLTTEFPPQYRFDLIEAKTRYRNAWPYNLIGQVPIYQLTPFLGTWFFHVVLPGSALAANSLCREHEGRTMRKAEVEIANFE
jgi:hypothetical protein